jgi:hypothetical protein
MMTQTEKLAEIDLAVFEENRRKHIPPESLLPYRGQHVAYNAEGTAIVASAPEMPELYARLKALGIPQSRVVIGWIPGDEIQVRFG